MNDESEIIFVVNGKEVLRQPMRSFVRNFIEMLHGAMGVSGTGGVMKDTTGASYNYAYPDGLNPGLGGYLSTYYTIYPVAGEDDVGICLGTGSDAVAIGDYNLSALITSGSSSGKLDYQDQGAGVTTVVGKVSTTRITRSFINNSGAAITIREVGLFGVFGENIAGWARHLYMMTRDVLGTPIVLADEDTLNVYFDMKVSA